MARDVSILRQAIATNKAYIRRNTDCALRGLLGDGRTISHLAWSRQAAPAGAGRLERGVRRHRGTYPRLN